MKTFKQKVHEFLDLEASVFTTGSDEFLVVIETVDTHSTGTMTIDSAEDEVWLRCLYDEFDKSSTNAEEQEATRQLFKAVFEELNLEFAY